MDPILVLVLIVAIVVGAAAALRRISPWWLFLAACAAGLPSFVEARAVAGTACDLPAMHVLPFWLSAASLVVGVTLYDAAAVDGIIDGIRVRGRVDVSAWFLRSIVCILASAGSAFVLFLAVLSAALRCD